MPPIRVAQHARPAPVEPAQAFAFPRDHHLLVTTENHVWSWDHRGLTNAFRSGSGGILAAKEAKDGSGLLAVADDQVVVLHDTNRGMDRSYRLKGSDGQIRLLEYSIDSKSLFFTTTLQNAVQSYSLRQACLLEPSHTHPSPPTALAISPTSHLLLSASEHPPTIYLQNITLRTPALLLQPRASSAAVETATFHPERANVFLLAFRDGTLAAYDATRILGKAGRGGSGGEVGRFRGLHTVTNRVIGEGWDDANVTGDKAVSITSAAFLPGHRSRAVSVGADGRCRLVDFECGGNILRTWHAKGPATSLSVLSVRQKQPAGGRAAANRADANAPNNTLAVGREDGKVLIFDSVGILLGEQTVDAEAGRIIDVEWMKGPGLKPDTKSAPQKGAPEEESANARTSQASPLGKNSALDEAVQDDLLEDMFGDDTGTVNYNPMEGDGQRDLPAVNPMNYMDLFSPVKAPSSKSPQRRSPRPRARPRILSSTFRQSSSSTSPRKSPVRLSIIPQLPRPDADSDLERPEVAEMVRVHEAAMRSPAAKRPTKLPSPSKRSDSPVRALLPQEPRIAKTPAKTPRARKSRRVSARMPSSLTNVSASRSVTNSSSNSKILADIRRLGESGGKKKTGLALLAPYMNPRNTPRSEPQPDPPPSETKEPERPVEKTKVAALAALDDIWLTSDDDAPGSTTRSRARRQPSQRRRLNNDPAPKDTQNMSRWASESTQRNASTAAPSETNDENMDLEGSPPPPPAHRTPLGLTPGAGLSPSGPADLGEYFPRRRSLAAAGGAGNGGSKRASLEPPQPPPHSPRTALGDLDYNTVHSPRPRSGRKSGLITGTTAAEDFNSSRSSRGSNAHNSGCDCGSKCCASLRKEVRSMGEELRLLREQMAEMRRALMMDGGR